MSREDEAAVKLYGLCRQQGRCDCGLCAFVEPVREQSPKRPKVHYLPPVGNKVACNIMIDNAQVTKEAWRVTCYNCGVAIKRNQKYAVNKWVEA